MLKIIVCVAIFASLSAFGQVAPILLEACSQMEPASKRSECLRAANQVRPAGTAAGTPTYGATGSDVSRPPVQAYAAPKSKSAEMATGHTCYVGPRGGTYTITKSGRKNYSGC